MLNVSYDIKPLGNVKRIRMNVIDSFINEERIVLSNKITKLLMNGKPRKPRKQIKKLYDESLLVLENELEKKRIFQIKLKAILSCRLPESIIFIKQLNEDNKNCV